MVIFDNEGRLVDFHRATVNGVTYGIARLVADPKSGYVTHEIFENSPGPVIKGWGALAEQDDREWTPEGIIENDLEVRNLRMETSVDPKRKVS